MSAVDTLVDRWFSLLGYNDEMVTYFFDPQRNGAAAANRLLSRMRKEYNSEMLTFCVLRFAVEAHMDVKMTVRDAMSPRFAELADFIREVRESPLNAKVSEFRRALERFTARADLIGELTDDDICRRIAEVGPLSNIRPECMASSGRPAKAETRISKDVIIAGSLGELLLKTEGMPDGMVLGYVRTQKASEGFFSLIYRSNGNVISVNDRPVEKYFGQFEVLSGRNDRYTEDKSFSVFPYESILNLSFKEDGVHDIIRTAEVRRDDPSFDDFSVDEAMRFFIGCMLIASFLAGMTWETDKVRYTTALMRDNIPLLETKALVNQDNRQLVESYRKFRIAVADEDVTAVPGKGDSCCGRNTSATLFSEFFSPDMVDLYDDYTEMLPSIRERYPNEVVAGEEDLRKMMLLHLRENLAAKIQEAIDAHFVSRGNGEEGIREFRHLVLEKKDIVWKNLVKEKNLDEPGRWNNNPYMLRYTWQSAPDSGKQEIDGDFLPFNDPGDTVSDSMRVWQKDAGGKCNMVFTWEPRHIDEICRILEVTEDELPREMHGYTRYRNICRGNSLLDITDPCEELQNGYTKTRNFLSRPFDVIVAMSKKMFNKTFPAKAEKTDRG